MYNVEAISSYIERLYENEKKNDKKQRIDLFLLKIFVEYETLSAYQCNKILNEEYAKIGKSITYKNVHKKVKDLKKFGYIVETKKSKTKSVNHGAIHYRISSFGLYSVMKHFEDRLSAISEGDGISKFEKAENILGFIEGHESDDLFELFLYPFITKQTIWELKSRSIFFEIGGYLSNVCKEIDAMLKEFEKIERDGFEHSYEYLTSKLADYEYENEEGGPNHFLENLSLHGVKWKYPDRLEITTIKENELYRISDGFMEILLTIFPEKQNAIITYNGNILTELQAVRQMNGSFMLRFVIRVEFDKYKNDYIHSKFGDAYLVINKLCFPILEQYMLYKDSEMYFLIISDIKWISFDSEFMKAMQMTLMDLEKKRSNLMELFPKMSYSKR